MRRIKEPKPPLPVTLMRAWTQRTTAQMAACVLSGWVIAATGCGDGRPATFPVTGEVHYNGQPVAGASVVFTSAGPPAKGVTDAQGKFTLRTFAEGDGALAGEHRVTITKNVAQPAAADNPYPETKNVLPAKYARPDTSQLAAVVNENGEHHFRFDLQDGSATKNIKNP